MKKLIIALALLISLTPISAFAEDFDYGYFGADAKNKKTPVIQAGIKDKHRWLTFNVQSDGSFVLRTYGAKGSLLSQKVYTNNQQFNFNNENVYGIQIQLLTNKGTYARATVATSENPNAETVNFFEEPF
ncbi:MAG TPA: hypothetical protein GX497_03295 [Bacillus bacterium]|nr:hypothetical protein [Bacillus sp. (in: firmicutes)]